MIGHIRHLARLSYFTAKRFPLYACLRQLQASQYWTRAQLSAWQDEKLRTLIRHVYDTVPYYNSIMRAKRLTPRDIRGVADLPKLPYLSRRDIQEHGRELISTAGAAGRPTWHRTGGTTGEPLQTANDRRGSAWANAAYYRGLGWAGYDFHRDRLASLTGGSLQPRARTCLSPSLGGLVLHLPAADVSPAKARLYHERLCRFRPEFLKGYSNATYLLARTFEEAGLPAVPLEAAFVTSEHLPNYQCTYIERTFGAPVYRYYGSVEVNSLGYQCERRDGYHIPEEHAVIETLRDGTETLAERQGSGGAFLITDLDNYYMPLIRYRNGDAGVLTGEPCPCGRTLKRIKVLYGRVVDLLRSTSGHLVPGCIVDLIAGETEHIREICLIQESQKECRLQYVAGRSNGEIAAVVEKLRFYLGSDMTVHLEPLERIPLTPAGKRRFTISKLNDT